MTTPSPIPEKTTSGIAVDPRTLTRVVPESRRPDGSIRKEIKIRPGFTPREDVTRFRGTRQAQQDRIALPEGHILGWVAPSSASKPKPLEPGGPASKSAKKNEKRKGKRDKKKEEIIRANWEEEAEAEAAAADVVKDPDGAPNWAETAKRRLKLSTPENKAAADGDQQPAADKADGDGKLPAHNAEDIGDNAEAEAVDVVKDPDGAPNWAETAKRRLKLSTPENKAAADEDQQPAADKADGDGELPAHNAEDIGDKLKHLEIL
ncbi:hypothetical protein JB92DRAFT_2703105 [Gautieria morchelliformis]|nr:hypothetical protein JB92DRAFT_2703105 [Gautieria morchelliformis]